KRDKRATRHRRADGRRRLMGRTPRESDRGRAKYSGDEARSTTIQRDANFLSRMSEQGRGKSLAKKGTILGVNYFLTKPTHSSGKSAPGAQKLAPNHLVYEHSPASAGGHVGRKLQGHSVLFDGSQWHPPR